MPTTRRFDRALAALLAAFALGTLGTLNVLGAPSARAGASSGSPNGPLAPRPELRLASGVFRPLHPASLVAPAWLRAKGEARSVSERRYLVAIADGPLDGAERARMESAGAELIDYFPDNGYRVRLAPDAEPALRALPFLVWVGELPAHHKVAPALDARARAEIEADSGGASPSGARTGAPSALGGVDVRIVLFSGEGAGRVLDAIEGLAATAAPAGRDGAWRVSAHLPEGRIGSVLSAAASLPEVEAVETAHRFRFFNQDAVWVHQSFVGPSPQQTPVFDRGHLRLRADRRVADSGQDYDTCFFRDTVNGAPPIVVVRFRPVPCRGARAGPPQGHPLLQLVRDPERRRRHLSGDDHGRERPRYAHVRIRSPGTTRPTRTARPSHRRDAPAETARRRARSSSSRRWGTASST